MARIVSRAELARMAGVTKTAVTKALKTTLSAACSGDRVDADHPSVAEWLARENSRRTSQRDAGESCTSVPTAPGPEAGVDVDAIADLTLRELVARFGTDRKFRDWLDALKKIEDIRKTRLDNEETERSLISRELVQTHVFGAIDAAFRRLLSDAPKTAARRAFALAKSGGSIEECEKVIREINSSNIKPVKASAVRVLKNA
jgi:hypothetical protein